MVSISEYAFSSNGNNSLPNLTIPGSLSYVQSLGNGKDVIIEDGVVVIGGAFENFHTTVTIPRSVIVITTSAFINSPNLTIKCYAYSFAHKYAIQNNIKYILLNEEDDPDDLNAPIILIPGIMGSRLFSDPTPTDFYQVWPPNAWTFVSTTQAETSIEMPLPSIRALGTVLKTGVLYPPPPKIQNGLEPSKREYGANNTYKEIVDGLCDEFDSHRDVYVFSYDWREDISMTAIKLKKFIDEDLKVDHVDMIGHSMGGLVASKYYSMLVELENKNIVPNATKQVNKIITAGTPYEGAPTLLTVAMNGLIGQKNDLPVINVAFNSLLEVITALNRDVKTSFISVAELAPTRNYIEKQPMWQGSQWLPQIFKMHPSSYFDRLRNIFSSPSMDIAMDFHDSIQGESGYNTLLDYDNAFFAIGVGQRTVTEVVFSQDKWFEPDRIVQKFYDLKYNTQGDGTVPFFQHR